MWPHCRLASCLPSRPALYRDDDARARSAAGRKHRTNSMDGAARNGHPGRRIDSARHHDADRDCHGRFLDADALKHRETRSETTELPLIVTTHNSPLHHSRLMAGFAEYRAARRGRTQSRSTSISIFRSTSWSSFAASAAAARRAWRSTRCMPKGSGGISRRSRSTRGSSWSGSISRRPTGSTICPPRSPSRRTALRDPAGPRSAPRPKRSTTLRLLFAKIGRLVCPTCGRAG